MKDYATFDVFMTDLHKTMRESFDEYLSVMESIHNPLELLELSQEFSMFALEMNNEIAHSVATAVPTDKEGLH